MCESGEGHIPQSYLVRITRGALRVNLEQRIEVDFKINNKIGIGERTTVISYPQEDS